MHVIAAKAVVFKEAMTRGVQAVPAAGARQRAGDGARCCRSAGCRIVSGRTECHLFLVDLRNKRLTGREAEAALGKAHITVNKNSMPNDPQKPFVTSGIRVGSPAMTTRGMTELEAETLANLIADVLDAPQDERMIARGGGRSEEAVPRIGSLSTRLQGMKCPFCKCAGHPSHRLPRQRRRREHPAAPALPDMQQAVHDLRDDRAAHAAGRQAGRQPRGIRSGETAHGLHAALHKRPVPTQLVDEAVATITQDVLALGEREIESRRIGEMVMRELNRLDQVAYIRFASVYRSFQGVDDFQDAIKEVQRPTSKPTAKAVAGKDPKASKDGVE